MMDWFDPDEYEDEEARAELTRLAELLAAATRIRVYSRLKGNAPYDHAAAWLKPAAAFDELVRTGQPVFESGDPDIIAALRHCYEPGPAFYGQRLLGYWGFYIELRDESRRLGVLFVHLLEPEAEGIVQPFIECADWAGRFYPMENYQALLDWLNQHVHPVRLYRDYDPDWWYPK